MCFLWEVVCIQLVDKMHIWYLSWDTSNFCAVMWDQVLSSHDCTYDLRIFWCLYSWWSAWIYNCWLCWHCLLYRENTAVIEELACLGDGDQHKCSVNSCACCSICDVYIPPSFDQSRSLLYALGIEYNWQCIIVMITLLRCVGPICWWSISWKK